MTDILVTIHHGVKDMGERSLNPPRYLEVGNGMKKKESVQLYR